MGAWIETLYILGGYRKRNVAPYVGAWIETFSIGKEIAKATVAPYVGAWIETRTHQTSQRKFKSHPTWVRGLKRLSVAAGDGDYGRTLRGCVD